jgi:hypothetical protein
MAGRNFGEGTQEFYGSVLRGMSMVEVNQRPAGIVDCLNRRESGSEIIAWQDSYIYSADVAIRGTAGDVVLARNSQYLRAVNRDSTLELGALVLSDKQWEDSKNDGFYLNAREVLRVQGKGLIKKNVWGGENSVVERILNYLGGGRRWSSYAELVVGGKDQAGAILRFSFDEAEYATPTLRPLVVAGFAAGSDIVATMSLDYPEARMIGIDVKN